MSDPTESAARARWRSAEDRLYPTLIANPDGYQRALADIQVVLAELRRRGEQMADLIAADAAAEETLAAAGARGSGLPADLLVGVACGLRDRELAARREQLRVEQAIAQAREAGHCWASLTGPPHPEDLTDGRCVALHLDSGTVLTATIEPWSGDPPFGVQVTPSDGAEMSAATSRSFADRAEWLADYQRTRAEIEAAPLRTGTPS